MVKNLPAIAGDAGHMAQSLHQKEPLEEEMATHSSSLAGKSHGWGARLATVLGVTKSWTQLSD